MCGGYHPSFCSAHQCDLQSNCATGHPRLIRFERPDHGAVGHALLATIDDLANCSLSGHRLLLAVGARQLQAAVTAARLELWYTPGCCRQLTPSERQVPRACPATNWRCSDPLPVIVPGLGAALCRRWQISDVVCRQSGGVADGLWCRLCQDGSMRLWKLRRPVASLMLTWSTAECAVPPLDANTAGPQAGAHNGGQ